MLLASRTIQLNADKLEHKLRGIESLHPFMGRLYVQRHSSTCKFTIDVLFILIILNSFMERYWRFKGILGAFVIGFSTYMARLTLQNTLTTL